jgi:hypothetical protein
MRRWPISVAPRDGTVIVGCTRVEGVEYHVRWGSETERYWISQTNGMTIPEGLLVEWRRVER